MLTTCNTSCASAGKSLARSQINRERSGGTSPRAPSACARTSISTKRNPIRTSVRMMSDGARKTRQVTAVIEREGSGYVALCPELDIASQGDTVEEARRNLIEAVELFFETAEPAEVRERLHSEVFVTYLQVAVG